MSADVFDWLLDLGGLLTSFAQTGYLQLRASMLGGALAAALTLTLMIYALGLILGWRNFDLQGLAKVLGLFFIVVIGVTGYGLFGDLLIDGFFHIPQEFAIALMNAAESSGAGSPGSSGTGVERIHNAMRSLYAEVMVAVGHLANSGSGIAGRILVAVLTVVVLTAGAIMLSVALFNIVLAQAATALLLALTPLFFIFLLFQATREMFWKWWGQLWNYFFLVLLTYVVLSLFLGIVRNSARQMRMEVEAGGTITLDLVAPFLLITLVATFMLFVVHGMATGLGGGVAMNTAAVGKAAGAKMAGWANRGHKAFGRGVDSVMARTGLSQYRARGAGVGLSRAGGASPDRSGVSTPSIGSGLSKTERVTGLAESRARNELRDLDKK